MYRRSRAQHRPPRDNNKRVPKRVVQIKDELSSMYLAAGHSTNLHAIGIGVGSDGSYCIQFFVSDAKQELWPGTTTKTLPASYKGVPLVLVQLPRANFAHGEDPLGLREQVDVIVGGVSGANKDLIGQIGTLGFFCRGSGQWRPRPVYVLSNSHVLVESQDAPAAGNRYIVQPSPGEQEDNQSIGQLWTSWPLLFANPNEAVVDLDAIANFMDAALARLNPTQDYQAVLPMIGAVRGSVPQEDVAVGETVRKVGRTTSYTQGRISSIVNVWIQTRTGQWAYFKDQFLIEPLAADSEFIRGGDSGSLVVEVDNYAIGLICAAGSTRANPPDADTNVPVIYNYGIANPISKILDTFAIELLTD